ncbi:LacI family DNA-binding transcriptional regulator [Alteromonas ponticola]|uniref:LacI family transcriptional regulator n=1 Tax=Alteromonas ponticola TaxID=2720613 RepID=A0ABX1R5G7_9ALTE|nr:LacI family DNA-binding transcriptional regulator [Alteromonas ponticola]NMH60886.1 LacI family transcriptional regulator [Alteromonas ponticola]
MKIESAFTLADLAALAGVSTSTASRALKDNPLIKKETREKVQTLARQHNYRVNASASRLRTKKTHVIAVILNLIEETEQSITDPFLLKLVGELNQALNAHGYDLLLSNSVMASNDWANYFITSGRADGLIVIGQGKSSTRIDHAAATGVPLVVWGDPTSSTTYPIIGGDNRSGGYQATKHLFEQGKSKIAFLGDPGHAEMNERHAGYLKAHVERGITPDSILTFPIDITSQAAYEYITRYVKEKGLCFDGIVAVSDMVAFGALKALKERYINVPADVGLVGYDDIILAELMHPALTTIRQDTRQAAQCMVSQLLRRITGEDASSVMVNIDLVIRSSS